MSKGVNKVILIGNCRSDPETRHTSNGAKVSNVSLATNETWNDRKTGDPVERTEWHKVIFFNRLAEIAEQYLNKGSMVYIEGSLRTRKWMDKNGQDRYTTEVIASTMQMLGNQSSQINKPKPDHTIDYGRVRNEQWIKDVDVPLDSIVIKIEEAEEREAKQRAYSSGSRFFSDVHDEGFDRAWRQDTEIDDIQNELLEDQDNWHRSSEEGWYYSDEDPE